MKVLYRIIAALAALLTIPVLYFQKLCRIVIDLGFIDGYFDDEFSINEIVTFFRDNGGAPDIEFDLTSHLAQTLAPLKVPAIITLAFLCLMVVMIFAVFFCSIFTNATKVNMVFSALGVIAVLGTIISFNNLTNIVISGELPLSDIVNAAMADSGSWLVGIGALLGLGSAVDFIGKLVIFQLGSAFVMEIFIFLFIFLWSLSFILINMEPYKEAKQKKAKKK